MPVALPSASSAGSSSTSSPLRAILGLPHLEATSDALVTPALFDQLRQRSSARRLGPHASGETNGTHAEQERICVALRLKDAAPGYGWLDSGPQWALVWASKLSEEAGAAQPKLKSLSLPLRLAQQLIPPNAASSNDPIEIEVQPQAAIPLSKVFLSALDDASFRYVSESPEELEAALDGRCVRQGSVLSVKSALDGRELSYRIAMSEPVLQGILEASSGATDIVITTDAASSAVANGTGVNGVAPGQLQLNGHVVGSQEFELPGSRAGDASAASAAARGEDDVDIDERFLAMGVIDSFERSEEHQLQAGDEAALLRLHDGSGWEVRTLQSRATALRAIASWAKHQQPHPGQSQPNGVTQINGSEEHADEDVEAAEIVDEENVVLVDELGLANIGAFEGDWALAELAGHPNRARMVRLFNVPASTRAEDGLGVAHGVAHVPPVLLQNLHAGSSFNPTAPVPRLLLRPLLSTSPTSGSGSEAPPLPFADAITISRVATPLSINRTYQPLFFDALRRYFEGSRRIVREGDVICVGIQGDKVRWVRKEEGEGSGEASEENLGFHLPSSAPEGDDDSRASSSDLSPAGTTALVYFVISNLIPELSEPPALPSKNGASGGKGPSSTEIDLQVQLRTGAFGCIVEPSLSNMVQAGVDCLGVVDASRWLGAVSDTPSQPIGGLTLSSPLTSPSSPFGQLLKLVQATLLPHAAAYGLHLTALLKGARGSGKKTVARWVAKQTGCHIVELDCFDLISDTDARTEGVLRARFSQAASCSPAIVLLRNVEAFARKSQALETGQEPVMAGVLQDCIASLQKEAVANAEKQKAAVATAGAEGDDAGSLDGSRKAWLDPKRQLPVAVFATTSEPDKCPSGVLGCFKHEVSFEAPNEAERLEMLQTATAGDELSPDVNLKSIATQTAALVAADLTDLIARARLASVERIRKSLSQGGAPPSVGGASGAALSSSIATAGVAISGADLDTALSKARSNYSESIGAPKIPNVTWDDVGGLASVKEDILDTIQLPLEHPELFSDGLKKRSGILLYGPPGTGKTLLAKAVATSCALNFFSVKGPELLNMYIGESEANVRRVFQRARDAKPCVIFFDELDSVAPKRGNQGDSGGVMDRIVSQLLAELDGMAGSSEGADVFVIGATNRPDLLDPALLRPGRFDRMLYLSVSETHAAQLNILQALTRKFKLEQDVGDLSVIAEQCPLNLTGADFYALCSDAMLKAMTRKASEVDARIAEINSRPGPKDHPHPLTPQYYLAEMAEKHEIEVRVGRQDFEGALRELTPSVSQEEMEHYRQVQAKISQPSDKKGAKDKGKGKEVEPALLNEPVDVSVGRGKGKAREEPQDDKPSNEERLRQLMARANALAAAKAASAADGAVNGSTTAGGGVGDGILAPPQAMPLKQPPSPSRIPQPVQRTNTATPKSSGGGNGSGEVFGGASNGAGSASTADPVAPKEPDDEVKRQEEGGETHASGDKGKGKAKGKGKGKAKADD